MFKKICFIVNSPEQYPYISELLKADVMANVAFSIIAIGKQSLKGRLSDFVIKAITAFEKKTSSSIKPLPKATLSITANQLDLGQYQHTLFIQLASVDLVIGTENGNSILTIEANQKKHGAIDTLVWLNEGEAIELQSALNHYTTILSYTTSNNSPLLTQRVRNLNGVFYDLLYYSIKKVLQK